MVLSKKIEVKNIITSCDCKNRWELIDNLINHLVDNNTINNANSEYIKESIIDREKKMSTGIGNSVAIPHCTTKSVDDVILAMAVLEKGISFNSIDNLPAQIIILLITPQSKNNIHIQTLTAVAKLLDKPNVKEQILEQTDPHAILKIIKQNEGKR